MRPISIAAARALIAILGTFLLQPGMVSDAGADQVSEPPTAEESDPAPQEEQNAADASKAPAKAATDEEVDLVAMQAAGYKIVNERGVTLYCKTEDVLNSRLRKRTRCLTAAEIEQERTAARNAMSDVSRNTANQSGD